METGYYKKLRDLAMEMTRAPMGLPSIAGAFIASVIFTLVLCVLVALGKIEVAMDELFVASVTVSAVALIGIVVYSVNLFRAAKHLDEDRATTIDGLELEIFNRKKRQAAISELWRLRSEGIELRNKIISNQIDIFEFVIGYNPWREETLKEAERVSENLRQWLERLDLMDPRAVGIHNEKFVQVASEILLRLGQFLEGEIYNVPRKIPKP